MNRYMTNERPSSDPPQESEEREQETTVRRPQGVIRRPYAWGVRNSIQLGVLLLTLGIGIQFFIFVFQISGAGPITVSRPPGVEGFLPIGALMGWKSFILNGTWDEVHPAAMVILGYTALVSLLFRKSFCGWFCPVGAVSEWLWKIGGKVFGRSYRLPYWIDIPLRSLKYLALGFFLWVILSMSGSAVSAFLHSPYYKLSDVKMLHFFTQMSALTGIVLLILAVSSLFVRNSWCRYLCPYGALMGLFALAGPTGIRRNRKSCIQCERCTEICPYHLPVHKKEQLRSPECNGCMDCTRICPVGETLEMKTAGFTNKTWSPLRLGAVVVGLFVALVYTAGITGHWKSRVAEHELRLRLQEIDSPKYTHPGVRNR